MDLTGYELETLRDDGEFALHRARQLNNPVPVLTLVAGQQTLIKRLEHEYALAGDLDSEWAARPLALVRNGGSVTLVLEDNGGEPLDRLLDQRLEPVQFLRLAINLATVVGRVHRRGLIHKDIKPAHMLVDATGNVRLTGFGIASRLPRERQAPAPPEGIAGSLAYIAPEQTGRMNRSIDARSDLYSLGVTLYEMLTGVLPFTASDPMEWIHCHIARLPIPPADRSTAVTAQLSAIVMKLLAKNAEDRYQTASGLEADLQRCLKAWEARRAIDSFSLGAHDGSDRLLIPEKLYGREAEIEALVAAFDQVVAGGTTEFVLVSGYAGVGKSSVVSELHKSLTPSRGLFAAGKFDQYKRDIPYATLAQAFQSLVRQILAKSEAEVSQWRQALLEALGPNGQIMASLIPELSLIIGEQPPVPELPPQDRQNRFQMVFRRFLGVFAQAEHPLALFLDDLQWLDAASLELLEHLVTHPEVRHLLLIGAYRDNEVSFVDPLMRMLASVGKAGARTTQIVLAPLGRDDVCRLVAEALRCDQALAQPLAELVHQRTAGNPFFTIQFLAVLAEERLLAFDPRALAWKWDMERIRAKGLTDNVVDLMIEKLRRLPKVTQAALQQLACLGNNCTIETLTRVYGGSEEENHATLWEAVRAGLVLRQNSGYTFLHDRVQEAAYALITEDERAASHLRIGRVLASSWKAPKEFEENIFEIVNQFDRGAALIVSREEREHVAELNLVAGKRARAASAYASALTYLATGSALLENDKWQRTYRLAFALELFRAECEYLTGDLASSEQRLAQLSGRADNRLEEASVACLRVTLYTNLDQSDRAIEVGLECLRRVGILLPSQPTMDDVRLEYELLEQRLGSRTIESLVDLPPMTDPDQRAALSVLSTLVPPANFSGEALGAIISIRMAMLCLEHGNGDVAAYAYVCMGTLLGRLFGDYQSGYRFSQLGLALTEKHDGLRARVYQTFSNHVAPWMQPLPSCRAYVRRAFAAAQQAGELSYAAYSSADLVTNFLAAGEPLGEIEREVDNALEFVRKAKFGLVADVVVGQLALVRSLRGSGSALASSDDTAFEERVFEQHLESDPRLTKPMGLYWIRKLQALFFAGDYASAIAAASKAGPSLWALPTDFELAEYHFYGALALAAACDTASPEQRRRHIEALSEHQRKITAWAKNCPENFANRAALLGAEIARLNGRELEAEQLYEEAIRSARGNSFVHNEAIANELAARFYTARGLRKISDTYLRDARDCYVRWGADVKVRQLDRSHPYLRSPARPLAPGTTFDAPVEQLDIGAMFKASQALSGEIVLSALIETLMRIAIENAGAERGVLILFRNDEARIAAEAVTHHGRVEVALQEKIVSHHDLPESALDYVMRTRASLIMDDATASNRFSDDDYVRERRPKSVLCVPVIKQTKLVGALYLENNLTPNAFTPQRIAVLEFLASQAAISLENAYLYADLVRSEAFLSEGQRISHTGSWSWTLSTGKVVWSEEHCRIFGHDPEKDDPPDFQLFLGRLHPEDRPFVEQVLDIAIRDRAGFACDFRIVLPDGLVRYVHGLGRPIVKESGEIREYIGTTIDVSEQKRNEDALRDAQADLVHIARLTTMGELVASIAHEVNQPLMAIVTNAETCLRWLGRDQPDIGEARNAAERIVRNGHRAGEVIRSIRALARKSPSEMAELDINGVIENILGLMRVELNRHDVSVEVHLRNGLATVIGDRVQLQQVMMNLIMNGIEAMSGLERQRRVLHVDTRLDGDGSVLVAVEDSGMGLDPANADRLFDPLFTTKREGLGMGLSISRSIVEAHGGRLWASPRLPHGATFQFALPAATRDTIESVA
jgi:predicted ATPase/signal transduction histidine kinase/GAF domain-containing protein